MTQITSDIAKRTLCWAQGLIIDERVSFLSVTKITFWFPLSIPGLPKMSHWKSLLALNGALNSVNRLFVPETFSKEHKLAKLALLPIFSHRPQHTFGRLHEDHKIQFNPKISKEIIGSIEAHSQGRTGQWSCHPIGQWQTLQIHFKDHKPNVQKTKF